MASPNRIFLLVTFLDLLSVFLILPYMDIQAKALGLNLLQIGLLGSVFPAFQLVSSPIVGSLSDVMGRKQILLFTLILCSMAYFWLGITSSLLVFSGVRAIIGLFKHTQNLTRSLAPDYITDPNEVAVLYGKLSSLGALGLAVGPVCSGYIMGAYPENGFCILCTLLAAIVLVNAGLIASLPTISNKKKDEPEATLEATKLYDSIVNTLKQTVNKFYDVDWTIYWDVFLYKLLISIAMGLYYSNSGLFLSTKHDMSPVYLGYMISFEGILFSIINNTVGYVNKIYANDKDFSLRIFHIFVLLVFSLIGLAIAPSVPIFMLLAIPKCVSFALADVVTLAIVTNRSVDSNRGTLLGAFNSVGSLAGIMTPLLGGLISHFLGVTSVFVAAAMVTTVGIVLSYQARSRSLEEKNK